MTGNADSPTPTPIEVLPSAEWWAWRRANPVPKLTLPLDRAPFAWIPESAPWALGAFMWACPTCGMSWTGQIAAEPVSGWDEPRWTNTGTEESPTLQPSLGCRGLRDGTCSGHWWLRDGVLVPA